MRIIRPRTGGAPAFTTTAFLLLALVLWQPGEAQAQWQTDGANISNTNSGNVGIGTSNPANGKLTVTDSGPTPIRIDGSAVNSGLLLNNTGSGGKAWVLYSSNSGAGTLSGGGLTIRNGTDDINVFTALPNGSVGIGTTAPAYKLDVAGQIRSSVGGFVFPDGTVQTTAGGGGGGGSGWTDGGASVSLTNSSAKVGIGTSAPASVLNLVGANAALTFGTAGASDASSFSVVVANSGGNTNGGNGRALTFKAGDSDNTAGRVGGNLILNPGAPTAPATSYGNVLLATGGGKVGIGKSNPTEALDVVGNIVATGNIAAKYQDVAEWVPSVQKLAAGTVVVLDADRSNHVLASASSYDTKVAGVVSAQPGLILGEGGQGKLMVATTGRVRVKADATRAAIKVGDLLVTGEVEGVAMKSLPLDFGGTPLHRPGTIIGKALEPLAQGTGDILVLLSLQ